MSAIGVRSEPADAVAELPVAAAVPAPEEGRHHLPELAHLPSLGFAHRTKHQRRRGSLVRRMLALADVVGLTAAYVIVDLATTSAAGGWGQVRGYAILLATLPVWIVLAKVYGLYDQDEERTHHPTTDDFIGVFHVVTVGTWVFYGAGRLFGLDGTEARPS